MNVNISTTNNCLVMDESQVLQLLTSVAQKLEILASTYRPEMLFKSGSKSDSFDNHSVVTADDLSAPSHHMSFDDDSVVKDAPFRQVPCKQLDIFLGSDRHSVAD